MNAMVVYDSAFGNTEQIAQAIGNSLGNQENVGIVRVGDVQVGQLMELELLIVGSPTQRFRPTPAISGLLKRIPRNGLKGVKVAAFDTRLTSREINETPVLAFFVRIYGFAARPIANRLEQKGGSPVAPPQGFFVAGMKGPLVQGELERAVDWARQITAEMQRADAPRALHPSASD